MTTATANLIAREPLAEHEQKKRDCLAQTALFLALAELTTTYGEEAAARYAENLGARIRNGEFSVQISRQ